MIRNRYSDLHDSRFTTAGFGVGSTGTNRFVFTSQLLRLVVVLSCVDVVANLVVASIVSVHILAVGDVAVELYHLLRRDRYPVMGTPDYCSFD